MKIKVAHLRDFLNQYHREEISFSMMVHLLNEVAQDNWISVEDDKPEKGQEVLLSYKRKKTVLSKWMPGDEEIYTHWQPIPEDPKGKEATNG